MFQIDVALEVDAIDEDLSTIVLGVIDTSYDATVYKRIDWRYLYAWQYDGGAWINTARVMLGVRR